MPLRIVPKENLKTAFRGTLQIASALLAHESNATTSVKHQRQVCQVPLAKSRNICVRRLNELRQRFNRDLLPPVSTTHEDVVDLL